MMDPQEEAQVKLGGKNFTYAKRRNYLRCEFVCGGITGLHPSKKWSTLVAGPVSDSRRRWGLPGCHA